jgi:hypothetical protein
MKVLSPAFFSLITLFLVSAAMLIPPTFYEKMFQEKYYLYLNMKVMAYILLSYVFFLGGIVTFEHVNNIKRNKPKLRKFSVSSMTIISLFLITLLLAVSNLTILFLSIDAIGSSLIVKGFLGNVSVREIKGIVKPFYDAWNLSYFVIFGKNTATAMLYFLLMFKEKINRKFKIFARIFLIVLFVSVLLNLILIQSRGHLISFLFFHLLIISYYLIKNDLISTFGILILSCITGALFVAYFLVTEFLKVNPDLSSQKFYSEMAWIGTKRFLGYTVACFNRLALHLSSSSFNQAGYPDPILPYYSFRWLWEFPILNKISSFNVISRSLYGTVPPSGWADVSPYISKTGLNHIYTAQSIFSYVYMDFGWFGTILYFFPYGFIAQFFWLKFRQSEISGVFFYPVILWSIVEWRGYIEISKPYYIVVLLIPLFVYFLNSIQVLKSSVKIKSYT